MARRENPGKRSDPRKVLKEQKGIMRDVTKRTAPKESFVQKVTKQIDANRRKKLFSRRPPPRVEGAAVIGYRRPRSEA